MDPCPFVRLTVGNLALKIPVASKTTRSVIHPSSSPCFCKIKLSNFHSQTVDVPYIPPTDKSTTCTNAVAASFHLSKAEMEKLSKRVIFLKINVYFGRRGTTCGVNSGRHLGKVSVPLDLTGTETKSCVVHSGWVKICGSGSRSTEMNVVVRAEPDPRFVFEFDGEPECSPQVFQIQGNIRQPVFSCKFSFRSTSSDRNQRSRSSPDEVSSSRGWFINSFGSDRERPSRERKGWSITIHDLSGSPVAAASMVTPFVASPGSDRVSRSNPGAWLILRPGDGTWKPWGRLEAWRERGASDGLGYRFELIPENGGAGVVLAESTLSSNMGGKFLIDIGNNVNGNCNASGKATPASTASPACSPRGSGDFGYGIWPYCFYRGFVMSANVEGEGKKCSKPSVEVSVQHVSCMEDAAAYVALAAAVDLSMDACRLFSQRLRKELCHDRDSLV